MPLLDSDVHVSSAGQTTVPSEAKVPKQFKLKLISKVTKTLPREILFAGPTDQRIRFRQVLKVRLYRDGNACIAYAPELEEFGTGDSLSFALDDLGKTIAESFLSLEDMKERLGADLQRQLASLRDFVELRRPA